MVYKKQINIIKAIRNVNRVKLILCLSKPQTVSELLKKCHLSQSALSQHLKILKECNTVTCKRKGKSQIYSVVNIKIIKIAKVLLEIK